MEYVETDPLPSPSNINRPSEEKAILLTEDPGANVFSVCPVLTSLKTAESPGELVKTLELSGEKATPSTQAPWRQV
jgi:hypothetical protein